MKSILLVTEIFEIGGLETHIQGEIKSLTRAGYNVHLATGTRFNDFLLPQEVASVSKNFSLGPEATLSDIIKTVEELRRLIRKNEIDCVHAHPFTSLLPSLIAAEMEGVPFALTLHGPASMASCYGPLYDFLLTSMILPNTSLVIAVSQEVADIATPFLEKERICILPNGVDVTGFKFVESNMKSDPRWLIVGRLDPYKVIGIADFIKKAKSAALPGVLLVGDGPAREELREILDDEGLAEFVEFHGISANVPELIQSAAGVAGMGRVVLEGLASLKPVCLVGYDGVKGLVDHNLLVWAAQANFSGRNLKNIDDKSFCNEIGQVSKIDHQMLFEVVAENFSEGKVWNSFLENLKKVKPSSSKIVCDIYHFLLFNRSSGNVPLIQSQKLWEIIGKIIHSHKNFNPSLSGSFFHHRDTFIESRFQEVVERDEQIAILKRNLAERDEQITALRQNLAERDGQITTFNEALFEQERNIERLQEVVAERDTWVSDLTAQISAILGSKSWIITRPFRFAFRFFRNQGLAGNDKIKFLKISKKIYKKLPLPFKVKYFLRSKFFRLTGSSSYEIRSSNPLAQDAINSVTFQLDKGHNLSNPTISSSKKPYFGVRRPHGHRTVAILTNQLLDWNDGRPRFGGGERYALELARLLKELSFEVTFFQPSYKAPAVNEYYEFKVNLLPISDSTGEFHHGICSKFTDITQHFDHVYYHLPEYTSGFVREDGLMTCHGIWFDHDNYPDAIFRTPEWFRHLYNSFSNPRGIISVDTNSIGFIRSLWPELAGKMRFIPNFFDRKSYYPKYESRDPKKITIIFPRRSQINRGSRIFGDIVSKIPHEVEIVWIGEGDSIDTQIIKDVCANDSRVNFTVADFDQMPSWYQKADIAVIPTIACEGTSLSCIEALACGCAVVGTNVGGLPDLIYNLINGLLVDPDASSIASAINRLIENPSLRQKLQERAVETAEGFEVKTWRSRWVDLLRDYGWIDDQICKNWVESNKSYCLSSHPAESEKWIILTQNAIHGGVESLIREEAKHLQAPVIVCGGHDQKDTCPFDYVRADNAKELEKQIKDYDIILYHWLPEWAIGVIRKSNKKSIEFVHRTDTSDSDKRVPKGLVTHSSYLAKFIYETYEKPCRVVDHAIALDYFAPAEKWGDCIGAITSYYETKGIDIFLRAWKLIQDEFPGINVRFYGSGNDLPKFKKMAIELGIHADFRGPTCEPWEAMKDFRCFVVPSRIEGLPVAILEALSMNLPVVASSLPGMVEFNDLSRKRGYESFLNLAEPENPEDLAGVIREVLQNGIRVDSNAYIKEYYSANKHCSDLVSIYREICIH